MAESNWKVVPNNLRERKPIKRGKPPTSELSLKLLSGLTVFVEGKNTFGSIYNLAKNNGKKARTQKTTLNDVVGTLVWLEDIQNEGE